MSCAAKYSFTVCQGATFDYTLRYSDNAGVPINLKNYGAKMQVRPSAGNSVLYLTLSSSLQADGTGLNFSGSASTGFVDPISGSIGIYISAISSSNLSFTTAEYDLFIFSGSFTDKILEGKISLDKRITIQ